MKKGMFLAAALVSLMVGSMAVAATQPSTHNACTTHKVCAKTNHQACTKGMQHAIYTCPMHPDIKSDKAGKCPKCGMNLTLSKTQMPTQCQKTMTPVKCKEHCK